MKFMIILLLEFDRVMIPFVTAENYKSDMDKSLLYVACTRAMHKLNLTFVKSPSEFIKPMIKEVKT